MIVIMKKILRLLSIILVTLFVSGFLILFFSPKPLLLEGISFSKAIYDEHQQLLRLTLSKDEKYQIIYSFITNFKAIS